MSLRLSGGASMAAHKNICNFPFFIEANPLVPASSNYKRQITNGKLQMSIATQIVKQL